MAVDRLADALNTIKTHEMIGQNVCIVKASKVVKEILNVLKVHQYIKDYKLIDDNIGGLYSIKLAGRINNCGVIKPRLPVKRNAWAKEEEQWIPGVGIGLLIVSTSKGIVTNIEADKMGIGGRLLAYVY